MKETSLEIRRKYQYRMLVLRGRIRISVESARGLIGPDCAYHLYSLPRLISGANKKRDRK
jgi:hypothetical protein